MSPFTYPAKFTTGSDGRILVQFVDLPRVATDGKDNHEAMDEAIDALGSDLSIRLSRKEDIPKPSTPKRGSVWCLCHCGLLLSWLSIWLCATSMSATWNWRVDFGCTSA